MITLETNGIPAGAKIEYEEGKITVTNKPWAFSYYDGDYHAVMTKVERPGQKLSTKLFDLADTASIKRAEDFLTEVLNDIRQKGVTE